MPDTDTPRHLAGAGAADLALSVLGDAGWTMIGKPSGNVFAYSPDGRVVAAWMPEGSEAFAPRANGWNTAAPIWVIRAYRDVDRMDRAWEATFTVDTPTEFVAAMLADLVRPEPLDPEREPVTPARS